MQTQIVFFVGAVCFWMAVVQANIKPGVYPNWPACKMGTEYVSLIRKAQRVEGTIYNEREKKGGTVKFYLCKPCTQCLSGIHVTAPCSVRNDTQCSTKCAVAGCVLDGLLGCRLPGDPNEFDDVEAMMDPCDPTVTHVTTTVAGPSNLVSPIPDVEVSTESSSINEQPTKYRPVEDTADGTGTSEAPVRVETCVFASLICLLFLIIGGILYWMFRHNRNKEDVRSTRTSNMIRMANVPNCDHSADTYV